jgi:hypothetical protein
LRNTADALEEVAKMLILDVKMRWSSTHQMLRLSLIYSQIIQPLDDMNPMLPFAHTGRALDYQEQINNYVAKIKDL